MLFRGVLGGQQALALEWMNEAVAISRRPAFEQRDLWQEWNAKIVAVRQSRFGLFTAMLPFLTVPATSAANSAFMRVQGELGATAILIAAERHRRRTGKWPDSIKAIDPSILPGPPVDPYTGEPFHLEHHDGQLFIYSFGPNGQDEHGVYDLKQWPKGKLDDVGARAWDVNLRRPLRCRPTSKQVEKLRSSFARRRITTDIRASTMLENPYEPGAPRIPSDATECSTPPPGLLGSARRVTKRGLRMGAIVGAAISLPLLIIPALALTAFGLGSARMLVLPRFFFSAVAFLLLCMMLGIMISAGLGLIGAAIRKARQPRDSGAGSAAPEPPVNFSPSPGTNAIAGFTASPRRHRGSLALARRSAHTHAAGGLLWNRHLRRWSGRAATVRRDRCRRPRCSLLAVG